MRRKRIRRHRSGKQNSGVKFAWFLVIIIGTVVCGYLTARFLIGPLLGYDTEVLKLDFPSKMTATSEEGESKEGISGSEGESNDGSKDESNSQSDRKSDDDADNSDDNENETGYRLQFGVFSVRDGAEALQAELKAADIETFVQKEDAQYKVVSKTYASKEKALAQLESLKTKKDIDVFITSAE